MNKDSLSLQDLTDAVLRKSLFRDMSKALCSEIARGACQDGPGSIAKLMERAFQTGWAMRAVPGLGQQRDDFALPMKEADLPSTLLRQLYKFKLLVGLGTDGSVRREPTPKGMVLLKFPHGGGGRDEWVSPVLKRNSPFSLKVISQMIQFGLYERPSGLEDGWTITCMTEWGFELLTTGATSGMRDRVPGSSTTYDVFKSLTENVTPFDVVQNIAADLTGTERIEPIVSNGTTIGNPSRR